ncbi:MAG: cytochrome c family protein [Desulfosarcina sp.]|jgi:hypothetical protein
MNGPGTAGWLSLAALCLLISGAFSQATANDVAEYVGSKTCGECHSDQYDTFKAHSKKADSYSSIQRMAGKLTPEELKTCYGCHTTGYGRPGGFQSEQKTPHLKDNGCEVCHGPGSMHVESEDPSDLVESITIEACKTCHNPERVGAFNFKPLIFGGAH